MTQRTAPCALRALRELGYHWYRFEDRFRLENWTLMSRAELTFANVYWNGDGHDVRLIVGLFMVAEESVDLSRGQKRRAVKARATAIMAKFREMAERQAVLESLWLVNRGGGGDARQRRKARRRAARLMAQAREEARKEVTP